MQTKPEQTAGKVRCLVCGEILDAAASVCPVCGAGPDKFVPLAAGGGAAYSNNTQNSYVILGNGCAGVSAAEAIRARDKTGRVLLISNEGPAYQRPMLTKTLLGTARAEDMALHPASWYEQRGIVQILGREAVAIDPARRTVTLDGGAALPYDKLILAVGSECFIPPTPGVQLKGVVAIRRFADVQRIRAMGAALRRAVVVGGGVLGLEAAWALRSGGVPEVTVLERGAYPMNRQLDQAAAAWLLARCADAGVQVKLRAETAAIQGAGKVEAVQLTSGEVLPADLVVISCGVRANTALASAAGIRVGRAIQVDAAMRTSAPDIYACGDCAEYQGVNYALWPEAQAQGQAAGAAATGDHAPYRPITPILAFQGMGSELFSLGDVGKTPGTEYQVQQTQDAATGSLGRYYFSGGGLCGVILAGDLSRMAEMMQAVEQRRSYAQLFGGV